MTCIDDDGIVRAWLDHELSPVEEEQIKRHLSSCSSCQLRFEKLRAGIARTEELFAVLAPPAQDKGTDPELEYSRLSLRVRSVEQQKIPLLTSLLARFPRPLWGVAAGAVLVAILVGFNPVRTLAQRFLAMLRVEKIAVVTIDPSTLVSSAGPDSRPYKLINQFLSDNVIVTLDPGRPAILANLNQAKQLVGYNIRTISSLGAPQRVAVRGETAFQMTLDRDRLQSLLEEVGRSDIQIPESANGALIAVHIPATVVSSYGDCPLRQGYPGPDNSRRERGGEFVGNNCTYLFQAPSPTVSVPQNLNMADIAEAALQLVGMSANEARSFCQTVDWSSTLVVPIPRNTGSYETVAVDGVEGTLITETLPQGNRYNLMWIKGGVIHALTGHGSPSDALSLAATLR